MSSLRSKCELFHVHIIFEALRSKVAFSASSTITNVLELERDKWLNAIKIIYRKKVSDDGKEKERKMKRASILSFLPSRDIVKKSRSHKELETSAPTLPPVPVPETRRRTQSHVPKAHPRFRGVTTFIHGGNKSVDDVDRGLSKDYCVY